MNSESLEIPGVYDSGEFNVETWLLNLIQNSPKPKELYFEFWFNRDVVFPKNIKVISMNEHFTRLMKVIVNPDIIPVCVTSRRTVWNGNSRRWLGRIIIIKKKKKLNWVDCITVINTNIL